MTLYSHSRLGAFEKCPLQYRYRYIDRIKRDTQSIEAFMGNCVHTALEGLYRDLMASRRPSLEELQARYQRVWDEGYSDRITIVRTENTPAHYREIGAACLTKYYRRRQPFDDGETVGLEDRVTVTLDPQGRYQLQGYIDRLVRKDDGIYEVHDFKTSGSRLPSDADLRQDRQLTIYRMAVAERYPRAREIRLVWHFLVHDRTLTSDRTPQEIERQKKSMIGLIDTIQKTTEYPPRVSPLCDWCEYRDICPEWKDRPGARAGGAGPPGPVVPAPRREVRWLDKAEQIRLFD